MNKNFFRMFTFVKPYKFSYIIGCLLYCSQMFLSMFIMSLFMNRVMAALLDVSRNGLIYASIFLVCAFVIYFLSVGIGIFVFVTTVAKATRDMKQRLFRAFINKSVEDSMSGHSGEGIAALNTEADTALTILDNALFPFLSSLISIVFSSVVVFAIDYRIGLATFAAGALAFFAQTRFAKPLGKLGKKQLDVNADSVKSLSNIFPGAIVIRVFGLQDKVHSEFNDEIKKLRKIEYKRAFISMFQSLFTTVQGWLTLVIVFALGGYLVATGRLDFPMLIMAPVMCMSINNGISTIGTAWAGLQAPIVAAERMFNILDSDSGKRHTPFSKKDVGKVLAPSAISASTHPAPEIDNYEIQLTNLSFKYKNADENTLNNINLEIGKNEMVAFVGSSGSGKSTLLKAIIGMYDRDDFNIKMGNMDFMESDPGAWRKHFAYVDQSCKLFDMSVSKNIALGAGGTASVESIEAAAKRAAAHEFISDLPEGYESNCGEKGSSLSGGQKQRVAIARALVRGAPVLVFDEATSALDAESEKSIMETINDLRSDHTVLITTHNLHNTINADKIVVLDKGHIVEIGTHEDLLIKNGIYAGLYNQ